MNYWETLRDNATSAASSASMYALETVPKTRKHQLIINAFVEFINKKATARGIDNMTIGEIKGIIKSMATSEDILNGFLETILKEIEIQEKEGNMRRPDENHLNEINELISGMNSKNLPFGTNAARFYGYVGTGEDKLPVVKKFLLKLIDLIESADPNAKKPKHQGGKREKSKSMTLKKRNLRRKSRKNGKNKRKKKASRK